MRDAPRMAKYISHRVKIPDLFISSHAARAVSTAEAFVQAFGGKQLVQNERLYHASLSEWYSQVSELDNSCQSVMCFGHNPGLTEFVNRLTGESIYNIPTCGVAAIDLPVAAWHQVTHYSATLDFYVFPKGLPL